MATKFVVDTHALLWFVTGDPRLGPEAGRVLRDPAAELVLPATALAEACWVLELGRITGTTPSDLLLALWRDRRIKMAPLTRAIVRRTLSLTGIGEMHDRQIAATPLRIIDRGGDSVLLTKDGDITRSGLVPVRW